MSERRACRLVGVSRSSWRDTPQDSHQTAELRERIKVIAHQRRRFGYRRIHDLLRFQGVEVNHKRIYRLYTEQKLSVKDKITLIQDKNILQKIVRPLKMNRKTC